MRTAEEIYQELLASFGKRTGLEPREGCDLSARMYALAAQVCALYIQADWVVRQAFPQTAEGEYLDAHAQLRGLARKRATAAQGTVRFTAGEKADAPREIPKGTVCMTAGCLTVVFIMEVFFRLTLPVPRLVVFIKPTYTLV